MNSDWLGTDKISPPFGAGSWDDPTKGVEAFINRGFKLVFIAFGLYALLNFILASYNFINSQGEMKNIDKAKKLFINSIIGLIMLSVVFLVAGILGAVFFGKWTALLDLRGAINSVVK